MLGSNGNDVLVGGPGADTLIGGLNNDVFLFNERPLAASRRPHHRLRPRDGHVPYGQCRSCRGSAPACTRSDPAFFWNGAAAHDANDYVVYNRATGFLSYDTNGIALPAAPTLLAVLTNKPVIAYNDFLVI